MVPYFYGLFTNYMVEWQFCLVRISVRTVVIKALITFPFNKDFISLSGIINSKNTTVYSVILSIKNTGSQINPFKSRWFLAAEA